MPIYVYRCANGHNTERLRKVSERADSFDCLQCGEPTEPIVTAPHVLPDGVYSYAPNIGNMTKHARRQEQIAKRNEARKHGEPTGYVVDAE